MKNDLDPISSVEDTEQTQLRPQMDRWMDVWPDGQTDMVELIYSPIQLHLSREYDNDTRVNIMQICRFQNNYFTLF